MDLQTHPCYYCSNANLIEEFTLCELCSNQLFLRILLKTLMSLDNNEVEGYIETFSSYFEKVSLVSTSERIKKEFIETRLFVVLQIITKNWCNYSNLKVFN